MHEPSLDNENILCYSTRMEIAWKQFVKCIQDIFSAYQWDYYTGNPYIFLSHCTSIEYRMPVDEILKLELQ